MIEESFTCEDGLISDLRLCANGPNIVAPAMLEVVACVLAVVCKRMQQLPKSLGTAVHRGKNTTHKSFCNPCVRSVRGLNNVERAVQMDPTLLRYASAITEQKKCWELLAEKFDRFQTLCNNTQQHPTTCNRVSKRTQHCCPTTSNIVGCYMLNRLVHVWPWYPLKIVPYKIKGSTIFPTSLKGN